MSTDLAPFPDELLTSWYTRRSHYCRSRAMADPKAVRVRGGQWRHPDIRPTARWLNGAARMFTVASPQLAANGPGEAVSCAAARLSRVGMAAIHNRARRLAISAAAKDYHGATDASQKILPHVGQLTSGTIGCWPHHASAYHHRWPLEERCSACDSVQTGSIAGIPARAIAHVLRRVLETP